MLQMKILEKTWLDHGVWHVRYDLSDEFGTVTYAHEVFAAEDATDQQIGEAIAAYSALAPWELV